MSIIISIGLGFLTTFLIRDLLTIDYLLSGNGIYVLTITLFSVAYYIAFTKTPEQKEKEKDNWTWIRITESRKWWERYFSSKVRDRVVENPLFKIK